MNNKNSVIIEQILRYFQKHLFQSEEEPSKLVFSIPKWNILFLIVWFVFKALLTEEPSQERKIYLELILGATVPRKCWRPFKLRYCHLFQIV